jgi:hypothetical protein
MINLSRLPDFTDMTQEKVQECLEQVDLKSFRKNPTQALIHAGITLKKGVTFKFVETEEEANALPANVIPLMHTQNDDNLTIEDLDNVAGGVSCNNKWHQGEHSHTSMKLDADGKVIYGASKKYTGGGED